MMSSFVVELLILSLVCCTKADKVERLLLNDPSVLADRLSHVENVMAILNITVKQLTAENMQQKMEIQSLKTTINTIQQGSTYIRWARKQCPNNNTELVYSGYAGGGHYNEEGASAEPVCLPPDPDFEKTTGSDSGRIYGAEFDNNFFAANGAAEDVPCAVCRIHQASSVIMIPGKNRCYGGWNLEYHGYLGSNYHGYKAAGSYVCIDIQPEFLTGGKQNDNGKLFYGTHAKCGSLQCPPYIDNYPLTCVVCSK